MAKQIKQYRFFGPGDNKNYPATIKQEQLIVGDIFFNGNDLHSITELGIQAYPGTKFFLNDSTDYVLIGSSGRYELHLTDGYEITSLRFDEESVKNMPWESSAYIIVDAVYSGVGE